jgi:cardiolipin synthase
VTHQVVPEDGLSRALDRVCATRPVPGNAVRQLVDGPEALSRMLHIVAHAQQVIHFENYIFRSDETGQRFAAALIAAAARGVSVRVLYDHFGSFGTKRGFWRRLRDAGVEVRAFNVLNPLHPIAALRRNHRKYVAADGTVAVVGGVCIGDAWAGDLARDIPPWRDTAVDVSGPVVARMDVTFQRAWRHAGGTAPSYTIPARVNEAGPALVRVIEGLPGRYRLLRAVELLLASAADRVWITDAYLVPATSLLQTIISTARAAVDVRILVPGRTDLLAVRALTRVGYRELLENGVRIFEWHGPMLHAKTVLVDDVWYKVGSSNLNPSSLANNYELDALIQDRDVAMQAAQQFRRDLSTATEIVLRPLRIPRRLAAQIPPLVHAPHRPAEITVPVRAPGERRQRMVVALRQVVSGTRRSIAGVLLFTAAGTGALFLALPRFMGYLVATTCFVLGARAAWFFLQRRRGARAQR